MCYVHAGHDSPEIERSDAADSQLQSSDSQDDSENDTQLDCSKIVVVLWYCSRRSRRKTLQVQSKGIRLNVSREGNWSYFLSDKEDSVRAKFLCWQTEGRHVTVLLT